MLLMQEIAKADAVKGLFYFSPDFCPNHPCNAILSLVAFTGLTRLQAMGQGDGPFQSADDVSDGQLSRLARQQVSACGPPDAVDNTGFPQSVQYLLQVGKRNPLTVRDLLDGNRPIAIVPGDFKNRPHTVFPFCRELHSFIRP